MKRCCKLLLVFLVVLVVAVPAAASLNLETLLPFTGRGPDTYFMVYQVSVSDYPVEGQEYLEYRVYSRGDTIAYLTTIQLHDGTAHEYQFTMDLSGVSGPEPEPELFFTNYELRVVGLEEIAGRQTAVVDLVHKLTNQKVVTYAVDLETSMTLRRVEYDSLGQVVRWERVVEIDFQPDFSELDFTKNVLSLEGKYKEVSKEEVLQLLPWLQLDEAALPPGFAFIGYALVEGGVEFLEENVLRSRYPGSPVDKVLLWFSDGLKHGQIRAVFVGQQLSGFSYPVTVLDTSPADYSAIQVEGAGTVLSLSTDFMTAEEQLDLLKTLVP